MLDFEFIRYEKRGRIAYLTLNRPEVLNAMHAPAGAEMAQAWDDFAQDDESFVAIVTGAGERAFSAGMDLRWRAAADARGERFERARGLQRGFGGLTNPRHVQVWKPIIAAVNGYAVGGGLELALACDMIVAAEHAQFGLPEPRRGIVAGAGGVHRLPRQMPLKVAMGYLLTGRLMTAQEALRWGLVNEVVSLAELMPAAERWAREIMECAPISVRATKQAATMGLDLPLAEAYNGTYAWWSRVNGSEDAREGVLAFAEKRTPAWTGR